MKKPEVTWRRVIRIWWAGTWRYFLYTSDRLVTWVRHWASSWHDWLWASC